MAENKKSNQADAYMESMKAYQKTYDFLLYLYLTGSMKAERDI